MRKTLIFILLVFVFEQFANAQCDTCPPNTECNTETGKCESNTLPPPPGDDLPIDSNVSLLMIAGLFIGATYIFRSAVPKKVE